MNKGFTQKYQLKRLVYYEPFGDVNKAIEREKTLKNWARKWKLDLIESVNPHWLDLYELLHEQGNVMVVDPQSNVGRSLLIREPSKDGTSGSARLDAGSGPA